MRIDPLILRGVVFVCDGAKNPVPVGTGFAVGLDPRDPRATERYALKPPIFVVTARHVLEGANLPVVRVNTTDGRFRDLPAPREEWVHDPNADCSIWHMGDPYDDADLDYWPEDMFSTEAEVTQQELLGEQVFFVGLFSKIPGQQRIKPIVRFGNIVKAEATEVRFEPDGGQALTMKAYLVEAHSWGGHSGSPAFVRYSHRVHGREHAAMQARTRLLGMVSGHYEDAAHIKSDARQAQEGRAGVVAANLGIAVVVPADRIAELIQEITSRHNPKSRQ